MRLERQRDHAPMYHRLYKAYDGGGFRGIVLADMSHEDPKQTDDGILFVTRGIIRWVARAIPVVPRLGPVRRAPPEVA